MTELQMVQLLLAPGLRQYGVFLKGSEYQNLFIKVCITELKLYTHLQIALYWDIETDMCNTYVRYFGSSVSRNYFLQLIGTSITKFTQVKT